MVAPFHWLQKLYDIITFAPFATGETSVLSSVLVGEYALFTEEMVRLVLLGAALPFKTDDRGELLE